MLARTLVNFIAIAVVAGSMVRAWWVTHERAGKPDAGKPGEASPPEETAEMRDRQRDGVPWEVLQREAERARRRVQAISEDSPDRRSG
jgi:hypothetical protein